MADDSVIRSGVPFCLPTFLSGAVLFPSRAVGGSLGKSVHLGNDSSILKEKASSSWLSIYGAFWVKLSI